MSFLTIGMTAVAVALLSSCASAEDKGRSSHSSSATSIRDPAASTEELKRISAEYDRAWLQQDSAALHRVLADDYTQIDPQGKVLSKADVLANAKSGDIKVEVGHSEDVTVRAYGDTAVVSGRWIERSTVKGRPFAGTMLGTSVWVKKNGTWQVVSDQVTLIAPQ